MSEYEYKAPSAAEMQRIMDRAHQMRNEAIANGFRAAASWVRGLFTPAGQPAHR